MTAAGDAGASAVFGIPDVLGPAPGPGSASALRLEATQALTADRDRLAAEFAAARAEVEALRDASSSVLNLWSGEGGVKFRDAMNTLRAARTRGGSDVG